MEEKINDKRKELPIRIFYRIGASIFWGMLPVLAILSGGMDNPVLYMTVWAGVKASLLFLYLMLRKKNRKLFSKKYRTIIFRKFIAKNNSKVSSDKVFPRFYVFQTRSILLPFQSLYILLFALSIRYVSPVVAAIIIEAWAILDVSRRIIRPSSKESKGNLKFIFMVLIIVTLVTFSNAPFISGNTSTELSYWLGIIVIVIAIVFSWQSVTRFEQSKNIAKSISRSEGVNGESKKTILKKTNSLIIFFELLSDIASTLLGIFLLIFFNIFFNIFGVFGSFTSSFSFKQFCILIPGSFIIITFGTIFSRKSEIQGTSNKYKSKTHTFTSLTPVFSILFIALIFPLRNFLSKITNVPLSAKDNIWPWLSNENTFMIELLGLLVIGLIGMFIVNILAYGKEETETYTLLGVTVSLWISGALIYFRDSWIWWNDSISKIKLGEYYTFLALTATVFTLLTSFEITRITQRNSREKKLTISLLPQIRDNNSQDREVVGDFESLRNFKLLTQEKDKRHLEAHYLAMRESLQNPNRTIQSEIEVKLGLLVNSRQYDQTLSSRTTMSLVGAFIIILSLFLRPANVKTLTAVLVDTFAFILPTVICYSLLHFIDLRAERFRTFRLEVYRSISYFNPGYTVVFLSSQQRALHSLREKISFPLFIGLIPLGYIVLYYFKWYFG